MLVLAKELGFEAHPSGTQLGIDEGRLAIWASSGGKAKENIQLEEADHRARFSEVKARLGLIRQRRDVRSRLVVLEISKKSSEQKKQEKI